MKPRIFSISFLLCLTFPLLCANADSIADRRTTSVQGGWDSERWLRQSESTAKALLKAVPDRYGPKQTPLWLSVIDPAAGGMVTVKPPNWQTYWDAEDYMMMAQGCNVYRDMPMLEALVRLSELSGVAAYRESVEACLGFFLSECVSETTGLFPWGEHLSYNTVRERIVAKRHELEHNLPVWDVLWRVNPEAVQREIEAIYRIHIYDKETFLYDRHGNYYTGEFDAAPVRGAYIKHSGLYAHSFAYLYSQTKEPKYLEWAEKISEVYWRHRDPKTGLLPGYVAPHGSGGNTLSSQMTLAYFLMRTVDLLRTVDPSAGSVIESHALAMVDSYLRYGFEPETGTFALTVIPSTGKPTGKVVEAWSRGENAYWQCMSACWEAYRRTKNPKYLEVMEIGARTAANTPIPDKVAPEPVGLWIELFGKIYTVTGNEEYLRYARSLAEWSCEHLLRNDLILESASGYVYHNYSSPGSLVQGWLSLYELEREVALHWTAPESIHPSAGEVVVTAAAGDVGEGLGLRWKLRDGQTGNVQGTKQNDTIVFTVRLPGETPEGPLGFEFVQKGSGEVVGTGQSLVAENPAGPVVGPWRLPEWTDREMSLRGSVKVTDETGLVTVVCHYRLPDGRQGQLPCMPNPDEDSWYRFSIPAAGRDVSGETALWIEARGNPEWPISTVTTEQVVPLSAGERSTVHHRSGELFSLSSANGQVRFTLVPDADIRFGAVRVESIPVEAVTARTGLPEKTLSNVVRVSLDGAVRAGGGSPVVQVAYPADEAQPILSSSLSAYRLEADRWVPVASAVHDAEAGTISFPCPGGGVFAVGGESLQLWRRTFNGALLSSPAVARVKQDGTLAVILDTRAADGVLYALNAEGKTLWTYDTGQTQPFTAVSDLDEDGLDEIAVGGVGLTLLASDGTVLWNVPLGRTNAPVIGDVDNDGRLEVVAATGGGLVAAFSAEGEELWRCEVDDNLEMPVLSDLNGDGALDLVVGGERSLWAVSGDGQPLWKAGLPGESLYSPAVGDLDGDGKPEIVAFTRTDFNGTLSVFGSDGTLLWDTRITREADWCPMIVDLLGVGQPQILVQAAKWEDLALYNAVGERVWTIPIESRIIQTPVPVDFDGDGRLDVALACNESRRIWALTIEGAPLWSYIPHSYVLGGAKVKGGGSLLIADIDGDERLEVVGGDDETWLNAVQTDTPCERWAVVSGQFHGDARHSGYYCISKK